MRCDRERAELALGTDEAGSEGRRSALEVVGPSEAVELDAGGGNDAADRKSSRADGVVRAASARLLEAVALLEDDWDCPMADCACTWQLSEWNLDERERSWTAARWRRPVTVTSDDKAAFLPSTMSSLQLLQVRSG